MAFAAVMVMDKFELEWFEMEAHDLSDKVRRLDHIVSLYGLEDEEAQRSVPKLLTELLDYLEGVAQTPIEFGYDLDKVELK